MRTSQQEIDAGDRFAFGANWRSYLDLVDDDRIRAAAASLTTALRQTDLRGQDFLDVGCGSGLFSLAAHRMGASVYSFDFDADSVAATDALRSRFGSADRWTIRHGSALDGEFLQQIGRYDIVYAWGVLHHTGDMWRALDEVSRLVRTNGRLFLSIYNDQGFASRMWRHVKRRYNRSGRLGRLLLVALSSAYLYRFALFVVLSRVVRRRPIRPERARERGMSIRHDLIDWVGGYPYEVARPEQVLTFLGDRHFRLRLLNTTRGIGCNEFVFERVV